MYKILKRVRVRTGIKVWSPINGGRGRWRAKELKEDGINTRKNSPLPCHQLALQHHSATVVRLWMLPVFILNMFMLAICTKGWQKRLTAYLWLASMSNWRGRRASYLYLVHSIASPFSLHWTSPRPLPWIHTKLCRQILISSQNFQKSNKSKSSCSSRNDICSH